MVVGAGVLADDALETAARLTAFAPARVLLVLQDPTVEDVVGRALRLGVDDVIGAPVHHQDLRLRLEVLGQRPHPGERGLAVGDLLHELTNVLAAMRLTGFVVGRLEALAGPHDERLAPAALADRLDREVSQAVELVGRVSEALGGAGRSAPGGAPWA